MVFSFVKIIKNIIKNVITNFGYKVLVWEDEVNPSFTNYQMRGNFTNVNEGILGSGGNIDISGDAFISKENEIFIYGLLVKCCVKDGLNLLQKNVFLLNIDGKEINFDLNKEFYSIEEFLNIGEKYIIETNRFLIEREFMKIIADSSNVKFKIRGINQTIEGYFSRKNITRFKEFYYDYLQ